MIPTRMMKQLKSFDVLMRFRSKVAKLEPTVSVTDHPIQTLVNPQSKQHSRILSCGYVQTGALGLPNFMKPPPGMKRKVYQTFPYQLKLDHDITSVSCGYGFTTFATSKRRGERVWGTGINTDSQLGFQPLNHNPAVNYDYLVSPSHIHIPFTQPNSTSVIQLASGRAHTLVLTDSEGVYSLGNNAYGQCGRPIVDQEDYHNSRPLHRIDPEVFRGRVTQVTCGQDHSLFLTDQGEVYSCGWGADGQTGRGDYKTTHQISRVTGELRGVRVIHIATHADCCLAVCSEGGVYGWGNNEYGQFSTVTDTTQLHTPRLLPFTDMGTVTGVAVGGTICGALNSNGEVFVWGFGALGLGPNVRQLSTPSKIPQGIFGRTRSGLMAGVTSLQCGMSHYAAVTNTGELFTWGLNESGCLGLGHRREQSYPCRVSLTGSVTGVKCGVDHTVFTAKPIL